MTQLPGEQAATKAAGAGVVTGRFDLLLIAVTIFSSACLLFLVQPIMGRYVLPWFGGGAGVWTACMLFFQMILLVGYAYAHLLDHLRGVRRQVAVHIAVLVLSLLLLPINPEVGWRPSGDEAPVGYILLLLTVHVGAPFAVLASSAPLIGSWYRHAFPAGSPYRLYALSNAGSLLALLAYPFLIEPTLTLSTQGSGWSWAYFVFALTCTACGWRLARGAAPRGPLPAAAAEKAPAAGESGLAGRAGWGAFLRWIGLAATGSVMLLATTSQISQEVSVVPMLWILPLAIYLVTFILCFERDRWYDRRIFTPLLVLSIGAAIYTLNSLPPLPYTLQLGIYAFTQFVCCMCCHGELARLRPASRYLTRFYLGLALGGALGGLFAAVLAPAIFPDYWEYHLALLATAGIVAAAVIRAHRSRLPPQIPGLAWRKAWVPVLSALLMTAFALPLGVHAVRWNDVTIESSRNFYGVNRIRQAESPSGPYREMYNGLTSHGTQLMLPELQQVPTAYYGVRSGLGYAFRKLRQLEGSASDERAARPLRIGVVGLGVGTVAALARAGDYLRFYEIYPEVERLARENFTFLSNSEAEIDVVIADARVALARESENDNLQNFDILVLDAFNGDSVPIHLLTEEAYALYRRHLKPGGILAFHTSNRHLALSPNVRALAERHGDTAVRIQSVDEGWFSVKAARWVLTTDNRAFLENPALAVEATPWAPGEQMARPWSDDFSSLWEPLKLRHVQARNKWLDTPNDGLFVFDVAQMIDEPVEDRIRELTRALYRDSDPRVPVLVITAKSLVAGSSSTAEMVNQLHHTIGLDRFRPELDVLILVVQEPKRIEIRVGEFWPPEVRSYLQQMLRRTISESMRDQGLSEALLQAARAMDIFVHEMRLD